jgi:hemoglobin/transferrin/lactoferrin receptor protein
MTTSACFISFAFVASASAQTFLDPLYVTAGRYEQPGSKTPYTVNFLDADFLKNNTRRTLPDALQYVPGVLVQKTANGHGSPYIRGFTGRQNLLLVDGVRVNNSTFRSGPVQYWNTVDPLAIDHIELVKSQGSVLYGSDAVGGTLTTFTKSSRFRAEAADQAYVGGSLFGEYRTNGEGSQLGRLELETGVGGKFGIMLGLAAKEFGDIEDSSVGRMKNTGYPEQTGDIRMDWALTPDSTLTLAHYSVNQDEISRWHRTLDNPGWVSGNHVAAPGKWTSDLYDQERSMTYLRYSGTQPEADAFITRWSTAVSYQTSDDSEFQNRLPDPAAGSRPIRRMNISTETTGFDLTLESKIGPGALVYGFDYYHDAVDSTGSRNNLAGTSYQESLPIADDSTYDLIGGFSQYVWKPIERLEITGGARYTLAQANLGRFAGGSDESRDWDSTVGSLRGIYSLDSQWSLYGGLSQAFRAPNLDDLSGNLTSKSGQPALGNINLDPERFLTYEIGTRHHTETTSLNFATFYTAVDDQIVATPISSAPNAAAIANNAANGYVYGVEVEGAWKIRPQWTLSGFAAWQDARTKSPDVIGGSESYRPNTKNLPLSGSVALRWDDASQKFWAETRVLAAATEDRISAADQLADNQRIPTNGTPSYIITSIRAGWKVSANLDLICAVENLTDQDYRNHGSGQNEPGLNGIFSATLHW